MTHIFVYGTPEARAAGQRYETLCILDESCEGILAHKGADVTVFLPWAYLARYGYRYVDGEV